MSGILKTLMMLCALLPLLAFSEQEKTSVDELQEPMYNPFVERYILDELKQLRIDLGAQKAELVREITDRQISSIDRGVRYATDTVTYFFYLIAAASSILVLVGWSSIRDIKDRVHSLADEEIENLVAEYEERLKVIENQMKQKSVDIEENREEIELTQEIQSLWLRAGRENNPSGKIALYDQILKLRSEDVEALTYKADAVLELNEPQWAINLCHQALEIDPDNGPAFYQLACAYAALGQFDEALAQLSKAMDLADIFYDDIALDPAFEELKDMDSFNQLVSQKAITKVERD